MHKAPAPPTAPAQAQAQAQVQRNLLLNEQNKWENSEAEQAVATY